MNDQSSQPKRPQKERKSVRFDEDLTHRLEDEAAARKMSFANLVRIACDELLARANLAADLQEMEARLAVSIRRAGSEATRASDDAQLLIAMLDQMVRFQLMTTPNVMDPEAAVSLGNKRYEGFVKELHKGMVFSKKRAKLSDTLDEMKGEPS